MDRRDEYVATGSARFSKRPRLSVVRNRFINSKEGMSSNRTNEDIATFINAYDEPSDEEIRVWQMHQLYRCLFENTLNEMAESNVPRLTELVDRPRIEENAIFMAINEHGLYAPDLESEQNMNIPYVSIAELFLSPGMDHSLDLSQPLVYGNAENSDTSSSSSNSDSSSSSSSRSNDSPPSSEIMNNEPDSEHFNFMETAVAAAIRKKGLTSNVSE